MTDEARYTPSPSKHQPSLDIPWMRLWEEKNNRDHVSSEGDRQSRLINIDYMTMLKELEFH